MNWTATAKSIDDTIDFSNLSNNDNKSFRIRINKTANSRLCYSALYYAGEFYGSIWLSVLICVFAAISNTILLYKKRPSEFWTGAVGDRLLFAACLLANILACTIQFFRNLINIFRSGTVDANLEWMIYTSAFCVTLSVLLTSAISLSNLYQINAYFETKSSMNRAEKPRKALLHAIFICSACVICAGILITFGFSSNNNVISIIRQMPRLASEIGRLLINVASQIVVGWALYKTRRVCARIQNEFALRRAQQSLTVRVTLRQVFRRTNLMVPLLLAHIILWITLITCDFIVDAVYAKDNQNNKCEGRFVNYSAWETVVDSAALLYCVFFPIILTRRQNEGLKATLRRIFLCNFGFDINKELSDRVSKSNSIEKSNIDKTKKSRTNVSTLAVVIQSDKAPVVRQSDKNGTHWQSMNNQWDMVDKNSNIKHTKLAKF